MNNAEARKRAENREQAGRKALPQKAVMKDYKRQVKPRHVNSAVSSGERPIDKNLKKINKRLVAVPRVHEAGGTAKTRYKVRTRSKAGALVTEKAKSARPFPIFALAACFLVTAVFMYIISLYIKLDDYNTNISDMKSQISQLHEDATVLEVGIETKFNLDMVEQVAVDDYGMVSADSLQKTYVSVTSDDIGEVITPVKEKNSIGSLFSGIGSALNLR